MRPRPWDSFITLIGQNSVLQSASVDPFAGLSIVPAKKSVLKNGLMPIDHEDKSAPFVAVNI